MLAAWCLAPPAGFCAGETFTVPQGLFDSEPRGLYRTGTEEELWIDEARLEPTTATADDKRHLMVQVWYPATFADDAPRAPYILNPQLYSLEHQQRFAQYTRVRSSSVRAARVLRESAGFPVLIYNPGGGAQVFSGIVQAEFLASHGYVVVAIGHTGLNGIERFPDGCTYRRDVESDPRLPDAEWRALSEEQRFRRSVKNYSERMMPLHVEDIRFVLRKLAEANAMRGNRFHGRLDLERVGSLGWSLGGALSLQASRDVPDVKAAVNLDGWLFTDVADTGTSRPILQIRTGPVVEPGEGADIREAEFAAESRFWKLYALSTGDWYDVVVPRARHGHFADKALLQPHDPRLLHPRLVHEIVNRYTLEFFDRHLRGQQDTPLLLREITYPDTLSVSHSSVSSARP